MRFTLLRFTAMLGEGLRGPRGFTFTLGEVKLRPREFLGMLRLRRLLGFTPNAAGELVTVDLPGGFFFP